uniref:Uncharacterized protein n=1 Tax=Leersia perrieri TaxID=77586 RepID=A0A0D9WAV5_9ORYZ
MTAGQGRRGTWLRRTSSPWHGSTGSVPLRIGTAAGVRILHSFDDVGGDWVLGKNT